MGGRRRDREQHWRNVLERQATSGLSVASFCRQESISAAGFYSWRRKLAERDSEPRELNQQPDATTTSAAQLLPVRIESSSVPAMVRVLLPHGVAIDAPSSIDHATLAGLVRAVRETAGC